MGLDNRSALDTSSHIKEGQSGKSTGSSQEAGLKGVWRSVESAPVSRKPAEEVGRGGAVRSKTCIESPQVSMQTP